MSQYTKSTNFATKDNLSPGDPLKVVRGTEIDTEFNNISTAIATKTDNSAAAITGGSITGITDLAVADGGTGASTAAGGLNNLLPTQTGNANKYLQSDGTNASWDAVTLSTADITGTLPVANGGTGVTASTGTGSVVLSNSPTLVTPVLGTPASGTATNLTGLPISTGVSGLGTGVATFLGTPSSANLASAVSDETGTGALVFANTPTLVTPILGTPTSGTLTNATGLPISTGVSGLGSGVATFLATPSSANLAAALTDETGSGSAVFATSPTLVTPILGTPTSATLTNATGLPISTGVSGLGTGIATALAVNVGSSGAPLVNGGVLGTPSSGTATNLTGLPLTTGVTGTLPTANGGTNLTSFTANGVVYASSSSALATNSAFIFDGSGNLGIGATSVNSYSKLQIAGGGSGAIGALRFSDAGLANYWDIGRDNGVGGTFTFTINGSEKARFSIDGNLGIGTSSPSAKLQVGATSDTSVAMSNSTSVTSGNRGTMYMYNSADSTVGAIRFGAVTDNVGTEIQFYTRPAAGSLTQTMTLNSAGNLKTIGTISVGDATPSTSGAGITFPATQSASSNANTLDDYEEGTWTPVVSDATTGGNLATLASGGTDGVYTKIGNIVYWRFTVELTSKASMTAGNELVIQGFPFQAAAVQGNWYNPSPAIIRNITFTGYVQFSIIGNNTYGYFRENVSNASGDNIIVSDITNSAAMQVSGFYRVA